MENSALQIYKAIGAVQSVIANATTLDDALQGGLKAIVENAGAESAVIWYMDKAGDGKLHPYFWIGPVDLTRRSHAPGDGAVGRVFESQRTERLFEFDAMQDVETAIGIVCGVILGCVSGAITVGSVEPSTAQFVKDVDLVAVVAGVVGSAVLAFIMSAIALRRIPRFALTDINKF